MKKNGSPPRQASLHRATKETDIRVEWTIDGSGQGKIDTGIRFLDHMAREMGVENVGTMGIGMTVICAREKAAGVLKLIEADGHRAWTIGEVIKGSGIVQIA